MASWLLADATYGHLTANALSGNESLVVATDQGTFPTPAAGQQFPIVINPNLTGLADNATTERCIVTANSSGTFTVGPLTYNHSSGEQVVVVIDSAFLMGIQIPAPVFITTTGTWTVPVTGWWRLFCQAPGGGGGGGSYTECGGGGGGQGAYTEWLVHLTAGTVLTATIGAPGIGGTGGTSGSPTASGGTSGGTSVWSGTGVALTAYGGGGAEYNDASGSLILGGVYGCSDNCVAGMQGDAPGTAGCGGPADSGGGWTGGGPIGPFALGGGYGGNGESGSKGGAAGTGAGSMVSGVRITNVTATVNGANGGTPTTYGTGGDGGGAAAVGGTGGNGGNGGPGLCGAICVAIG